MDLLWSQVHVLRSKNKEYKGRQTCYMPPVPDYPMDFIHVSREDGWLCYNHTDFFQSHSACCSRWNSKSQLDALCFELVIRNTAPCSWTHKSWQVLCHSDIHYSLHQLVSYFIFYFKQRRQWVLCKAFSWSLYTSTTEFCLTYMVCNYILGWV